MKTLRTRIAFAFGISLLMAFIMSGVLVVLNTGISGHFFTRWLASFLVAFPIAFPVSFFVAPLIHKIVSRLYPND